jgi:hypothetical protein
VYEPWFYLHRCVKHIGKLLHEFWCVVWQASCGDDTVDCDWRVRISETVYDCTSTTRESVGDLTHVWWRSVEECGGAWRSVEEYRGV